MMSTDRLKRLAAAAPLRAGLLLAASALACRGEPSDLRTGAARPVSEPVAPAEYPAAAAIDLGSDETSRQLVEGFSLPERVGARFASWSEGERSRVTLHLRGGASDYLLAFLAEPYHRLGTVGVSVALNGHPLGEARVAQGWRAYQLPVSGDRVLAGRNALSFQYSSTARPSDLEPQSSDVRALSVRFDQIQIAPITPRAQLAFASKNALGLSALGEGWARDPNDRGTGTWTVAKRALITFPLLAPAPRAGGLPSYRLSLTARAPQGAGERQVALSLNGAALGSLAFGATKTTGRLDVPAERLGAKNELWLEFARLESPAQLDPSSNDERSLGLRVFELDVGPRDAPEPAATQPEAEDKQPVAEAAALH